MGIGTAALFCGCHITRTMGDASVVVGVGNCEKHRYVFSEDKSLKQWSQDTWEAVNKDINDGSYPGSVIKEKTR